MKKLLAILVLGLVWCINANAAKGDGTCGLQSNISDMTEADISIKIAAFVKVKDTVKNFLKDSKKSNFKI